MRIFRLIILTFGFITFFVTFSNAENIVIVDEDLKLTIPNADVPGLNLSLVLDYYRNPGDPVNHYWKLDMTSVAPVQGEEWVLYDDFESNGINNSLWSTDCRRSDDADFEIENGKLKISLHSGVENDYCYAEAIGINKKIKAVKATVILNSATEDGRGRIRGDRYTNGFDYYYSSINIFGALDEIKCYTGKYTVNGDPIWESTLEYKHPLDIIGESFVVTLWFLPNEFKFEVEGLGEISVSEDDNMTPGSIFPFVLDVKSSSGLGAAIVYFDDVFVLFE